MNGFLPRSAGIGGKPSFLLNTANVDLRYSAAELPVMVFTRLQLVPRLYGPVIGPGETAGDNTRLLLEQAFGRITPLRNAELAISVGKFDSVFGIEYLENQANFRIGVTPSLIARYTTGQSVGVKAFYRVQIIPASSAISLNVAATNSGTFVESLQGSSRSLTGVPGRDGAARLRAEPGAGLGQARARALRHGPRNDQTEGSAQKQTLYGFDARLVVPTLTVAGEYVHVDEHEASGTEADRPRRISDGHRVLRARLLRAGRRGVAAAASRRSGSPSTAATTGEPPSSRDSPTIIVDRITAGLNVGIGENLRRRRQSTW